MKLSFQQIPSSISVARPSVFLSLSFLQGACVFSTARQNLPPRLLTAELQAGETGDGERDKGNGEGDRVEGQGEQK